MKTKSIKIRGVRIGMILLIAGMVAQNLNAQEKRNYRDYDATNVIYRGIDNRIRISVPHDSQTLLQVSCESCIGVAAAPDNPEIYVIRAGAGKEIDLLVKAQAGNITHEYKQHYKVSNLPPASLYLDGKANAQEVKPDLTGVLTMGYPQEIELPGIFSVVSWEMQLKGETIRGTGDKLSVEALNKITQSEGEQNLALIVRYVDEQRIQRSSVAVYQLKL